MPRYYPFKIEVDGRPYSGDWQLLLGGRICVRSKAFGSEIADVGRAKPETVAAETLERIVRGYQKRRAEELRRQERELEKIRRRNERERRPT